jgi:hypothetical protein
VKRAVTYLEISGEKSRIDPEIVEGFRKIRERAERKRREESGE